MAPIEGVTQLQGDITSEETAAAVGWGLLICPGFLGPTGFGSDWVQQVDHHFLHPLCPHFSTLSGHTSGDITF